MIKPNFVSDLYSVLCLRQNLKIATLFLISFNNGTQSFSYSTVMIEYNVALWHKCCR